MVIPAQFQNSRMLQYVISKGWSWKPSGNDKIELEKCPYCGKDNYGHFYAVADGTNREGLHTCHKCGTSGNLMSLQEKMGDRISGVTAPRENLGTKIDDLPSIDECHQALLEDIDAMDYLVNRRGFSKEIIEKQKLGLVGKHFFREIGAEVKALVYPYLTQGNCVFVHYRSLPPAVKAFSSPKGWEAPLYNGEVLKDGLKEVVLVEGEANVICLLDNGVSDVVGVPGANFKKAMWIDTLDQINPDRIYILYDKDKTGQKAAQTLASRIGVERCWRITLPEFSVETDSGEIRAGKDINEWFQQGGGTKEGFQELKQTAALFDVQGVASAKDALQELEDMLAGKVSLEPTYNTPWPSVNRLVGFEDGDVIDVVAPEKIGKTTFGMNLMEYVVDKYNEDGIIICLEMSTARIARKWVSHVAQFDDSLAKGADEAKDKLRGLETAIKYAREQVLPRENRGTLYFCYPQIKDVDDAYKLIHDCIRRYGVKWVMFDNLQLLADRTLKNHAHRTVHLSQISKTFAGIAKDYGIKFLRILQPHRIREGQIITTDDVDGASQIAKDCDVMMAAHRNRVGEITQAEFDDMGFLESESSFDKKMLLRVGLSRYSGGGDATLEFDGAMSTVREYNNDIKMKMISNQGSRDAYKLPPELVPKVTNGQVEFVKAAVAAQVEREGV